MKRAYQDGDGLLLLIATRGAKSWMLRVQVDGKRRDIGLGTADVDGLGSEAFGKDDARHSNVPLMLRKSLSLAEARQKAAALRKLAKAGSDPKVERDRLRAKVPTFAEAVTEAHKELSSGWSGRTAKAFKASLEDHANPKLGALKVNAIGSAEVIAAIAPIWTGKPVMARKVRSRIGQVLAFANARGCRADALPDARELRTGLSKQARGGNFAAMPFAEVPAFIADELVKGASASRHAVLFTILTSARSGEVRQVAWEQIDLEARTWTRPASVMTMKESHVITLSDASIAPLEAYAPNDMRKGLIFAGLRGGRLSDMSLTKAMRTAGRTEAVHGFRSAFRDWAAEKMPTIPAMVSAVSTNGTGAARRHGDGASISAHRSARHAQFAHG